MAKHPGQVLDADPPDDPGVALDHERTAEHGQETDERQQEMDLEGGHQEGKTDHCTDGTPADSAQCVAVE